MVGIKIKFRTSIEPVMFATHAHMTVERERIDSVYGPCQFANAMAYQTFLDMSITQKPRLMALEYDDGYTIEGTFFVQSVVGNVVAIKRHFD